MNNYIYGFGDPDYVLTEEELKHKEEMRLNAEKSRLEAKIRVLNPPKRYENKFFEDFIAETPETQSVLKEIKDYVENFDSYHKMGKNLFMLGKVGSGKTLMAFIIAHELLKRSIKVKVFKVMDLIKYIRDTWAKDSDRSEKQAMDYLQSLDLLIIDEIGVQSGTENEKQILLDIIDRRYNSIKCMIIIGNVKRSDLEQHLGDRAVDRLTEGGEKTIIFNWDSYRRNKVELKNNENKTFLSDEDQRLNVLEKRKEKLQTLQGTLPI